MSVNHMSSIPYPQLTIRLTLASLTQQHGTRDNHIHHANVTQYFNLSDAILKLLCLFLLKILIRIQYSKRSSAEVEVDFIQTSVDDVKAVAFPDTNFTSRLVKVLSFYH